MKLSNDYNILCIFMQINIFENIIKKVECRKKLFRLLNITQSTIVLIFFILCAFYAILYFQIFYKCIKVHRLVITFNNKRIKYSVFLPIVKLIANVIKVLELSQILIKYFVCMFSTLSFIPFSSYKPLTLTPPYWHSVLVSLWQIITKEIAFRDTAGRYHLKMKQTRS